jgi:FdhD protein
MHNETQNAGLQLTQYRVLAGDQWSSVAGSIVEEAVVSVFANGKEVATMMATPHQQEYLAIGYLYTEGFISSREDILDVSVAPNRSCVDVLLRNQEIIVPPRPVFTSGCGKGVTFAQFPGAAVPAADTTMRPTQVTSQLKVSPDRLHSLMQSMQQSSPLHRQAGGIHAAALASEDGLVVVMEDIGRHNTLDKLAGYCLMNGFDPAGHILLTTGRISSEMVNKAIVMRLPVIASLTSPTTLSVERAEAYNLTLVGYVRGRRMSVYSHPERLEGRGVRHED